RRGRREREPAAGNGEAAESTNILGPVGRLAVGVTALLLGGLLVAHAWQADRAHRLHLAAFRAAAKLKSPEQAVTYLEAAARITPADADLQSELGQAYLDRGQREREHGLDDVRRLDHVRLTALAAGVANPAAAAAAVAAWKDLPRPTTDRVPADRRAAVFAHAIVPALEHFALARRLCPLLPRPHMRFAAHAAELVRADEPITYWKRALLLAPADADLWYFAGVQRLRDGHPDEAWADWRKALELAPRRSQEQQRKHLDRLAAIVTAAAPHFGPDPQRRGEQLADRVLPDRPDDLVAAARVLDSTLSASGPARPLLDRALALLADRPEGLSAEESYLKAQVDAALGRDEDAVRAYERALTFAQAKPEWRYQFVKLLMERGRWKEARRELEFLRREMPNSQQVKDWIAEVDRELLIQ
ncbi:MAG TPA: tetratricopeptide repeat protein, partial [Gemmataceae bacterium]